MNPNTVVKYTTYFVIAAGNVLIVAKQPTSVWESVVLTTSCLVAGCVAIRAIQTTPPNDPPKQ